jgi:hypothetical protein
VNSVSPAPNERKTFRYFLFARHRDLEFWAGFALAGSLFINEPKEPSQKNKDIASDIIQDLIARVRHGNKNNIIVGWPKQADPSTHVDVYDDDTMRPWCNAVQVSPDGWDDPISFATTD